MAAIKHVSSGNSSRLLSQLAKKMGFVGISTDLAAIAESLMSLERKEDSNDNGMFQLFKSIACDVSKGYHLCSATTKRAALREEVDPDDVSLEVRHFNKIRLNNHCYALPCDYLCEI